MQNIMISCSVWDLEAPIYKLERDTGVRTFSVAVTQEEDSLSC